MKKPFGGHAARQCFVGMLTPATLISALEEAMERRFDTTKRSSDFDQQSLAQRVAEIRELRKLVRRAEAKRRQERYATGLARRHSFKVRENV
jgi:hypothetical protein